MEIYLRVFVNYKQDDLVKLLPIAKFTYNNTKNASINDILFELDCGYYSCVLYRKSVNQ